MIPAMGTITFSDSPRIIWYTPPFQPWGVFSMIQNLSETVIVPIAGVILTFVMCVELIQMVTERNNLHDDVC